MESVCEVYRGVNFCLNGIHFEYWQSYMSAYVSLADRHRCAELLHTKFPHGVQELR